MLVSVVAFLAASAAQAADTPPAASSSAAPAVKEKKICVVEEPVIGSNAPKRTCKTKAEWDKLMGKTGGSSVASDAQAKAQSNGTSNN